MEHLAIMKKEWKMIEKILDGRKEIESRWYSTRRKPWNCIKKGETIYFKNSGGLVNLKARVDKVLQFEDLTPEKIKRVLNRYSKEIGLEDSQINGFFKNIENKKYCILVFLKNPIKVKPFQINKKGFGMMSAWITVKSVSEIKNGQKVV